MKKAKKWKLWLILSAIVLVLAIVGGVLYILQLPPQNEWYQKDGAVYYMDDNRNPVTGWFDQGDNRYYLSPANGGAMHTGWLELEEGTYYLDAEGHLLTGWQTLEGRTCYFQEDGHMVREWMIIDGKQYYFRIDNGAMQTGWLEMDGASYYFGEDGCMVTGWQELAGQKQYFDEDGRMVTGWLEMEDKTYYLDENGYLVTGWLETDGNTYYLDENGCLFTGWLELEEDKYYLNEDGTLHTGWLELDGQTYYLKEDGTLAKGRLVIDEETYYFTSTGANIILVNPWNFVPDDYEVELVTLDYGHQVAVEMHDALLQMMDDCKDAGYSPVLRSSYRTHSHQQYLFNRMVAQHGGNRAKAAQIVAVPGTSEHELGLAVDIVDYSYQELDHAQEKTATQKWLMEHCWDYGFILRYPNSKSTITGIIYEPWHYRYVGLELAMELRDSGLCLEEYLDQLTNDGTTCGGQ
ncbi:MAG: D-alanyl-D-alanine carboxypeptidase family protein [Oscillospiraceae bacterium]|nr:D-alanyl-D-alanine carboxypeptidase family protein [Oscillospiraceae bacterium]